MSESEHLRQAYRAEKDLNSYQAKQGLGRKSDSTLESGVDENVNQRFPQAGQVKYGPGSTASGSDHRPVPEDEGGSRDERGRLAHAEEYQGPGGPEDKVKIESERRPGDQDTLNLQDMKRSGLAK
ncbi:hypothetical protein N7474_004027 [Penicillium riverlandense]|uniref:uncharacterized protein n=1 Tax=Penicillium riverlandense TaxID=1903569 RepID=UPI0025472382|nr:uncharacterized protein N7474_004027 [Penicillium riverlandense]KAJ5818436.1 hypothetical protein N7474_004027 [Penicillium riverlandense]